MKHLFVMDPLEVLSLATDSTAAVMRAATARGDALWWCTPDHLLVEDGVCYAIAEPVAAFADARGFVRSAAERVCCDGVDVVWMRKDPPFDMRYVLATYMLDLIGGTTLVVNDPRGLKLFNEKIWAMHFADLQPPTLLSADASAIRAFAERHANGIVLKPWDGNGGRGVLITRSGDKNLRSMIDVLSEGGHNPIIAQAYVSGVTRGDKRILLFDGEPVAAVLRVPGEADHRANLHVGASAQVTTLDDRDLAICARLAAPLKDHGQIFVGIDVIDGYLTEINVTSPTGFREAEHLYGRDLAVELLTVIDRKVAERKEST